MKCEKCLYKKNCQFLMTHRKAIVEGCDAFKSEDEIRIKAIREFADRLKKELKLLFTNDEFLCRAEYNTIDSLVTEMTE